MTTNTLKLAEFTIKDNRPSINEESVITNYANLPFYYGNMIINDSYGHNIEEIIDGLITIIHNHGCSYSYYCPLDRKGIVTLTSYTIEKIQKENNFLRINAVMEVIGSGYTDFKNEIDSLKLRFGEKWFDSFVEMSGSGFRTLVEMFYTFFYSKEDYFILRNPGAGLHPGIHPYINTLFFSKNKRNKSLIILNDYEDADYSKTLSSYIKSRVFDVPVNEVNVKDYFKALSIKDIKNSVTGKTDIKTQKTQSEDFILYK